MSPLRRGKRRLLSFLRCPESRVCYLATAIFGTLSYPHLFVNNISNLNDVVSSLSSQSVFTSSDTGEANFFPAFLCV